MEKTTRTFKIMVYGYDQTLPCREYAGASYLKWNDGDTILSFLDVFGKKVYTNLPVIIEEE